MNPAPSIAISFLMGFLSFLTPCVLPLVPAYISFISGYSVAELRKGELGREAGFKVFISALFFVLGFSAVFVLLGLGAGALGQLLARIKPVLMRIGGLVVIFFGLQLAGVFKLMPLLRERRYQGEIRSRGMARAFLLGLAFAFGWSPCVGPILGSILMLAVSKDTMIQGAILLATYSAGLAVPFLLTALLLDRFFRIFKRIQTHFHKIEITAGVILILIGLLMVIGRFDLLKYYLEKILPETFLKWG